MDKLYPVFGYSMTPLMEAGDTAVTEQCAPGDLRAGDIALLVMWQNGLPDGYVTHRVVLNISIGGKRWLVTKGDANLFPDLPLSSFQPIGRVKALIKAGRLHDASAEGWLFTVLYSLPASMFLRYAALAWQKLFTAACHVAPARATGMLNSLYRKWDISWYPAIGRLILRPVRLPGSADQAPAPAGLAVKSGTIRADETWSGRITVMDCITIAPGVKVTVLPGTVISFDGSVARLIPALRWSGGRVQYINSSILVYGEFRASGEPGRPLVFGPEGFKGIQALGSGRIFMEEFSIPGTNGCALRAGDTAALRAGNGTFLVCDQGIELYGRASGTVSGCVLSGGGNPALRLLDEASLLVTSSKIDGSRGIALEANGTSRAALSGLSVRGCKLGLSARDSSSISMKSCVIGGNSGYGLELHEKTGLEAQDCAVEDNSAGLLAEGRARLNLRNCVFAGNTGPAVRLAGSNGLVTCGCAFRGNKTGIEAAGDSALELKAARFRDNAGPSLAMGGTSRALASGLCSVGRTSALVLEGEASLELDAGRVRSVDSPALAMSGVSAIRAGKSVFRSVTDAVYAYPGCRLEFASCSAGSEQGAAVNGITDAAIPAGEVSRLRFSELCIGAGGQRRSRACRLPAFDLRRALFHFAVATYRLPLFSWTYRRIYGLGPFAAKSLLQVPGVKALYLYRGMTAKGWIPALSDMDLVCITDVPAPAEEWPFYARFTGRQRLLRKLLPFTGEIIFTGAADFASFVSSWGLKGKEFRGSCRLLAGSHDRSGFGRPAAPGTAEMADITEAFCSYTLLMRHVLTASLPPPFLRRSCMKSLIDVKRYLDPASETRASRRDYARAAGLDLDDFISYPEEKAAFEAFRTLHTVSLEKLAGLQLEPISPVAAAGSAEPGARRRYFDARCSGLMREYGPETAFVMDGLHRLYIVLPDWAASDRALFASVIGSFRAGREQDAFQGQTPVFLTRPALELLSLTSYMNNPLFWLDLALQPAGGPAALGDGGVYCHNLRPFGRRPSDGLVRRSAALSLSHFSATWRSQWGELPPHYFYSRAAGLRLLLDGRAMAAFSRIHDLSAAFAREYGRGLPAWEEYCAGGRRPENFLFVAEQAAAASLAAGETR